MLELYPGSGYSIRLQLNAKTRSESRQKVPDTTGSETLVTDCPTGFRPYMYIKEKVN